MSKIIESLIGKSCKISKNNSEDIFECLIIDVDEQWIKVEIKANNTNEVCVMRIEAIENIVLLDNGGDL